MLAMTSESDFLASVNACDQEERNAEGLVVTQHVSDRIPALPLGPSASFSPTFLALPAIRLRAMFSRNSSRAATSKAAASVMSARADFSSVAHAAVHKQSLSLRGGMVEWPGERREGGENVRDV